MSSHMRIANWIGHTHVYANFNREGSGNLDISIMQADFKVYLILTGKKNPTTNFVFKAYEFWTKAFWIGCINEQNRNCNSCYHGESFTLYVLGDSSQWILG